MSVLFALPALYLLVVFRTALGAAALAPLFGAAAVGLWLIRAWGRSLALMISLANAGLGVLGLVASILADTSPAGPLLFGSVNAVFAWVLSRAWFGLPGEAT